MRHLIRAITLLPAALLAILLRRIAPYHALVAAWYCTE
jgi:hypothetical protein